MTRNKQIRKAIATITITLVIFLIYSILEDNFYSVEAGGRCSCSITFYPTDTSRIIGYGIMIVSYSFIIAGVWLFKGFMKLWVIPAMVAFSIGFYGNGYAISVSPSCTPPVSLEQTTFFIKQKTLGDFIRIDQDSLLTEKYKGNFSDYSLNGNELTVYRIGEAPIKVKAGFLFWNVSAPVVQPDALSE